MSCYVAGKFLADFTIGLTDVSPTDRAPPLLPGSDYRLCGHYAGTVPDGQTVNVECGRNYPRGHFLFVLRRGSGLYLQLCELEVYALMGGKTRRVICTFVWLKFRILRIVFFAYYLFPYLRDIYIRLTSINTDVDFSCVISMQVIYARAKRRGAFIYVVSVRIFTFSRRDTVVVKLEQHPLIAHLSCISSCHVT